MEQWADKVIAGDCLEVMQTLPAKSVDMVLSDLPYGTTHNSWDVPIDLKALWKLYEKILKPSGVAVLTGQGIFTATLMASNRAMFRYKMVWVKSKATNFLNVRKQPLRKHEDICVFYSGKPVYRPQMAEGSPYDRGVRRGNTGSYNPFKAAHIENILGSRHPSDVLYFKTAESEGKVFHPTQKPVALGRYLISTYSNEGDLILDNACGSGSFLVSAVLEKRRFIGIEKNEGLIEICRQRIAGANEM